MTQFKKYDASNFKGSASSYAGQGICSVCGEGYAEWMKSNKAYCEDCKERLDTKESATRVKSGLYHYKGWTIERTEYLEAKSGYWGAWCAVRDEGRTTHGSYSEIVSSSKKSCMRKIDKIIEKESE